MAEAYFNSLGLKNVQAISSGCVATAGIEKNEPNVTRNLAILERNGLGKYAKRHSDQLTPERLHPDDVVVCMNQRACDESEQIARLPKDTIVWDINDIAEETNPPKNEAERIEHAEYTLKKIKARVDGLVRSKLGDL